MAKRTLTKVATTDLQQELRRRRRGAATLERKRDRLLTQLEAVEAELAELGDIEVAASGRGRKASGSRGGGGRKRPKNKMPLIDTLQSAMKPGKAMTIGDILDAVKAAGYKSSAANFRTVINQTLSGNKQFKRVERGVYALKK